MSGNRLLEPLGRLEQWDYGNVYRAPDGAEVAVNPQRDVVGSDGTVYARPHAPPNPEADASGTLSFLNSIYSALTSADRLMTEAPAGLQRGADAGDGAGAAMFGMTGAPFAYSRPGFGAGGGRGRGRPPLWTEEMRQRAIAMRREGRSMAEIGAELGGKTPRAVSRVLERFDDNPPDRFTWQNHPERGRAVLDLWNQNMTIPEIGRRLGLSTDQIQSFLHRNRAGTTRSGRAIPEPPEPPPTRPYSLGEPEQERWVEPLFDTLMGAWRSTERPSTAQPLTRRQRFFRDLDDAGDMMDRIEGRAPPSNELLRRR